MIVEASAPCRVDLAGGTLDIWPIGLLHPGSRTVNVAIEVRVRVWLERAPSGAYRIEQGAEVIEAAALEELQASGGGALVATLAAALDWPALSVRIESDSPRGGGLGASSALTVALLAAAERLLGRPSSPPARLARQARDLEARLMGLPTGLQDHFPALLGGALEIVHEPGGEQVLPIPVDLDAFSQCLAVFYSGQSHFSARNNWSVIRARLEGEPRVRAALDGVRDAAAEVARALRAGDWGGAGAAIGREWSHRRRLAPEISTPALEDALAAAVAAGAWGGKACGAGGGGCVAVLSPPERFAAVRAAVETTGARSLAARPQAVGLVLREG